MLLKSRASPDVLPFSICNKKRLAIRHMNRPLFPTTLSIPSYDIGLSTYQHHSYNGYGVMRLERGVDYPPPSSAEVNEKQNYTSTPPLDLSGLFWGQLYLFLLYIGHWSQTRDGRLLAPETPAKVNYKLLNQQQYHINVFIHAP